MKSETRVISGMEITCTQYPVIRGAALMMRLGKILAPMAGHLSGLDMDSNLGALGPAAEAVFTNVSPEELPALLRELLANTQVKRDGRIYSLITDADINKAFEGDMLAMLQAAKLSIEVNYSDFFGAVSAAIKNAAGTAKASG